MAGAERNKSVMRKLLWLLVVCALACFGCGDDGTTGSGGSGGATSQGGGGAGGGGEGGGESTTAIGTTMLTTSSTTEPPMCGLPEPAGCSYPEPFKGYHPGAIQDGSLGPAPGEDGTTASASCFDPLPAGKVLTRAAVGFNGMPPAELAIDAWTQDGADPGVRVPAPVKLTLESVYDGPDTLSTGVYVLATPLSGEGLTPCMGMLLSDHYPLTMAASDACYQPARSWFYGLPKNPDGTWTWSMLDCPEDDSILSYRREYPYELME